MPLWIIWNTIQETSKHSLNKLSCGYPVVILNNRILSKISTIFILLYFYIKKSCCLILRVKYLHENNFKLPQKIPDYKDEFTKQRILLLIKKKKKIWFLVAVCTAYIVKSFEVLICILIVPITMCVRSVMHFPFSICIMSFNRKHSWVPANWSNFAVLLLVACTQEWKASSFSPSPAPFDLSQDTPAACLLLNAIQKAFKNPMYIIFFVLASLLTLFEAFKWRGFLLRHCHQNNFLKCSWN